MLWVLGALSAFGPLSTDMYLPGLPAMARDLGASTSSAQLTISLSLIGLALGQLLSGPLSDSRGRRWPLLVGLSAYIATSIGCAVAPSIGLLLLLRLVQGVAGGAGISISRAVVRDRAGGESAARAYAALMVIGGLGPVVAPVAGGLLLHVTDWRGIFVTLAIVGALLLVASLTLVPETLAAERRDRGGLRGIREAMGILFRDRAYLGHTLAGSFAFGTMMAYIAASAFVLERIHGISPQIYSIVFAVNGAAIVVARQIATRRLDRSNPARILWAAIAVQACGAVGILLTVTLGLGLAPLLIGFFITTGCNGALLPMATALAMADHPERAGSASGLFGFTQFLIGSLVAPIVGVAGSLTAVPMAVTMPACSLLALLALASGSRSARAVT